ncbi:MAG: FlgD immunoglobulin-like domain containing protein [Candidatus Eisenbacteria bacterium]
MNSARTVLVSVGFCMLLGFLFCARAANGTIELTVPDTCAIQGDTLWLPIYTTDVTDSGVLGFDLDVKYDSNFVEIEDVTTVGSMSEVWGDGFLIWNVLGGQDTLRIGCAGFGTPLTGEGILIFIGMRILPSAPGDSTAQIIVTEAILRDDPEKPPVVTYPGSLTIGCGAGIDPVDDDSQSLRIQRMGPSTIKWCLESDDDDSSGDLRIYSARGRLITTIKREQSEGASLYTWNGRERSGRDVAGGIYFYEIKSGRRRWTGKVHILR